MMSMLCLGCTGCGRRSVVELALHVMSAPSCVLYPWPTALDNPCLRCGLLGCKPTLPPAALAARRCPCQPCFARCPAQRGATWQPPLAAARPWPSHLAPPLLPRQCRPVLWAPGQRLSAAPPVLAVGTWRRQLRRMATTRRSHPAAAPAAQRGRAASPCASPGEAETALRARQLGAAAACARPTTCGRCSARPQCTSRCLRPPSRTCSSPRRGRQPAGAVRQQHGRANRQQGLPAPAGWGPRQRGRRLQSPRPCRLPPACPSCRALSTPSPAAAPPPRSTPPAAAPSCPLPSRRRRSPWPATGFAPAGPRCRRGRAKQLAWSAPARAWGARRPARPAAAASACRSRRPCCRRGLHRQAAVAGPCPGRRPAPQGTAQAGA